MRPSPLKVNNTAMKKQQKLINQKPYGKDTNNPPVFERKTTSHVSFSLFKMPGTLIFPKEYLMFQNYFPLRKKKWTWVFKMGVIH